MASSSPPLRFARVTRLGVRAALVPLAALIVVGACSSPIQTPPQIGDCTASANMTCAENSPSGGVELPVDGGTVEDSSTIISESLDGASCGPVDTLLVSDCASCMIQFCCMSDSVCSNDTGCFASIQCAALGSSCPTLSPTSQQNLNDLLQCINLNCPSECFTVSNHDF
jgi:hypothetical protein